MRKNRDRVRIVADLLEAAGSGSGKTKIMFGANLSFKLLEKYLDTAVNAGFVEANGSGYELTKHGEVFLDKYRHFRSEFPRFKRPLMM